MFSCNKHYDLSKYVPGSKPYQKLTLVAFFPPLHPCKNHDTGVPLMNNFGSISFKPIGVIN